MTLGATAERRLHSLGSVLGPRAPRPVGPAPRQSMLAEAVCRTTLDYRSYLRVMRHAVPRNLTEAGWPLMVATLAMFSLASAWVFASRGRPHGPTEAYAWECLALAVFLAALAVELAHRRPGTVRDLVSRGPARDFFGEVPRRGTPAPAECEASFDADGVTCRTGWSTWRIPWASVSRVRTVGDVVVLVGPRPEKPNVAYRGVFSFSGHLHAHVRSVVPVRASGFVRGGWGDVRRLACEGGCGCSLPDPSGEAPLPRHVPGLVYVRDPMRELPLGTVVSLEGDGGEPMGELMVCGALGFSPGTGGEYDYCGCPWPEGCGASGPTDLFDAEVVSRVLALGPVDDEEAVWAERLYGAVERGSGPVVGPASDPGSAVPPGPDEPLAPLSGEAIGAVVSTRTGKRLMVVGRGGGSVLAVPWPRGGSARPLPTGTLVAELHPAVDVHIA